MSTGRVAAVLIGIIMETMGIESLRGLGGHGGVGDLPQVLMVEEVAELMRVRGIELDARCIDAFLASFEEQPLAAAA